ncbi:unnamed protein product [Symbiodinium necroappetens]|uniref:Nucleotide-diphospho-sugar transferase domain-containing protein n=1 Tax=Symbiodinium necroappetens TaxID=1628268 RepID=A0A812MB32_9DINO|nr:unnamed protein product [Symbiodinium necroappetens]
MWLMHALGLAGGVLPASGDLRFPDYVSDFAESEGCLPSILEETEPIYMSTELESILKEAANGSGIVVFSVFVKTGDRQEESAFAAQLKHWMCRARSVFGRDFLVFVDSERSRQRWQGEYGITPFFSQSWIEASFAGPAREEIRDSNYWRWAAMESILRAGYMALYVDTDILWLEDPRPLLVSLPGDADFFGSCDAYNGSSGSIRWVKDGSLDIEYLREESRQHDDESVCCQQGLVPVNAGVIFMRSSAGAISAVERFRKRIISGPCWGQAAMHWGLYEMCGSQLSCEILDPLVFASAEPLRTALRRDSRTALRRPSLIHLDIKGKQKATKHFERFFGTPQECRMDGRGSDSEL